MEELSYDTCFQEIVCRDVYFQGRFVTYVFSRTCFKAYFRKVFKERGLGTRFEGRVLWDEFLRIYFQGRAL